jgi:DNA-binding PadR family transcriptional regulator
VAERPLTSGDWSVLALVCEQPAHGWKIASALAPGGEIGAVWSVSRPLVYRSIENLSRRGLIESAGLAESSAGPNRVVYRSTPAGRAALAHWLAEPVEHLREARPKLLLKLVFAQRSGVDTGEMLERQQAVIEELLAALEERLAGAGGHEALIVRYRVEIARASLRFVEAARSPAHAG